MAGAANPDAALLLTCQPVLTFYVGIGHDLASADPMQT